MLVELLIVAKAVFVARGFLQPQGLSFRSRFVPRSSVDEVLSPECATLEALGWPRILRAVQARCGSSIGAAMAVSEPWLVRRGEDAEEVYERVVMAGQLSESMANYRLDAAKELLDGMGDAGALAGVADALDALEELVPIAGKFECPALCGSEWFRLRDIRLRQAFAMEKTIRSTRLLDDSSPALKQARQEVSSAKEAHRVAVASFKAEGHYFELEENRIVTAVDRSSVSKKKVHIRALSRSGKTAYVEPQTLKRLADALEMAQHVESQAEESVLAALWAEVKALEAELRLCLEDAARLDGLRARCRLGDLWHGTIPRVYDENTNGILALEARNPLLCLESMSRLDQVITVDLDLVPGRCAVLQGSNGGGKTMYLNTLGLFAILVKAAIPVPAAPGSVVSYFPTVLADLSTATKYAFPNASTYEAFLHFASHALMSQDALILLDELGSGTDSAEGGAIGVAVLDSLLDKDSAVCAATHHPAVKAEALARPDKYELWSFEADNFRPARGASAIQSANAIAAARRCGLPEEVIAMAIDILDHDDSDTEKSQALEPALVALEVSRQRATQAAEAAEYEFEQAKKMKEEALEAIHRSTQSAVNRASTAAMRIEQVESKLQALYTDLKKRPDANALTIIGDTLRMARLARKPTVAAKREALLANQGLTVPSSIEPGDSVIIVAFDHAANSISTQAGARVISISRSTADLKIGSKLLNKIPLTDLAVWDLPVLPDGSSLYDGPPSFR